MSRWRILSAVAKSLAFRAGPDFDEQLHQSSEQVIVGRRFLFDGPAEQADRGGQLAQQRGRFVERGEISRRRLCGDFHPLGVDEFVDLP